MGSGKVVIVGGGAGGDSAAFALRKQGFDGPISIVSADLDRPYDRPDLSKQFIRGEVGEADVYLHPEADYEAAGIELHLGTRMTGGSLTERRIVVAGGAEVPFDHLVLATGGTPRRPAGVPEADNAFTLRSLRDGGALRDALAQSRRLLVVGAGFIGAEVAASARALGKEVVLVEMAAVPLGRALGEEVGKVYASIHRSHGVELLTGTSAETWHREGDRVAAVTVTDGRRVEFDLVLIAAGIEPNLEPARALGLPLEGGGVAVGAGLEAADRVYCAGDIAAHLHPVLGRRVRVEHWEVAKGQGRGVAAAIAGGATTYARLPYFWSDQYDVGLEYRGQATGSEQTIWRGDREGLRFSVFYVRDGLIEAVLSVNDSDTNTAGGKLISARRPVDPDALADTGTDLAALTA